jgi:uncharacterized membrane protein
MYPNSERSTIFTIRNTGNYIDKTITVNISSIPEDWEVTIDSSDIPVGGLPRNSTADIEVTIITPERVVESDYEVRFALMSDEEIKDEVVLPVSILKVRKISLQCRESSKKGNISERISYIVTVENNGNSKDSVDLRHVYVTKNMADENWKVQLSKNFTTLYPYEARDVIVSVSIPLEAIADTNFLTGDREGYIIQIVGTSQNDTTVEADEEIEVVVNPIYDFNFNKESDRKYMILHDAHLPYEFQIENKGNTIDKILFSYESIHSWIVIPFAEKTLYPGVTEVLNINFEPPVTLSAGEYEFTIYGQSSNVPTLISSLNITVEIIESDIEISKIQIGDQPLTKADVKEDETVLIRALLTNVGDLDYYNKTTEDNENLVIRFMEGSNFIDEINITYLPSERTSIDNSIWVTVPWRVGKARTYTLIINLDEYGAFEESNIENNKLSGKLSVKSVTDDGGEEEDIGSSELYLIFGIIIICVILMLVGIWANVSITRRAARKGGYTADGEYKPYEEMSKAEFGHDEEEEEPEGGVLGIQEEHPYGVKKGDKFMKESLSLTTMRPIKKTKPLKKSKPLTSLAGEGAPTGLERPHIAGLLPPKKSDEEAAETEASTDNEADVGNDKTP